MVYFAFKNKKLITSCNSQFDYRQISLSGLMGDIRGAVAIEFALVMLPFCLLIFGIIEIAILYMAAMSLEDAVSTAGRQIRTGIVQSSGNSAAQLQMFREKFCNEVATVVACNDKLTIDVRSFTSFSSVTFTPLIDEDTGELVPTTFTPGAGGTINLVRVAYSYKIMTPLLGQFLGDGSNNTKILEASTVFRNEPF